MKRPRAGYSPSAHPKITDRDDNPRGKKKMEKSYFFFIHYDLHDLISHDDNSGLFPTAGLAGNELANRIGSVTIQKINFFFFNTI